MSTSSSTWLDKEAEGSTAFDKVFGLLPDTYAYYREFFAAVWNGPTSPVLLELARLRVAQLLGCESELQIRYQPAIDAGLEETKVVNLARYYEAEEFSPLEREVLNYAETFVMDPRGITDEQSASLKAQLTSDGLAQLTVALALFDGFARFKTFLGVAPDFESVTVVPKPGAGSLSLH